MNEFYKKALETKHDRRPAFEHVLNLFENKPIKVLVIGGERASTPESIYGDGFFSIYVADYIAKNGGKLVIVDIDIKATQLCSEIMSDFTSTIDLGIVCDDGMNWINKEEWDLVYLDGDDSPDSMYEQFKKIDLTKSNVFCDDFHGKGIRLRKDFQDFVLFKCNHIHEIGLYSKVTNNDPTFKIGVVTLPYVREQANRAWYNERALELGLAKYFSEKFQSQILEVGDVSFQYSYFKDWPVIDCAPVYDKAIKKSVLDESIDFKGTNILSISTLEHVGEGAYNGNVNEPKLAIKALEKIVTQAQNYLITIPVGANLPLQEYIHQNIAHYTIMKRVDKRKITNNWIEDKSLGNLEAKYGHFNYGLSYYGNALCVIVITNLREIIP